jgi:hypothetical protein
MTGPAFRCRRPRQTGLARLLTGRLEPEDGVLAGQPAGLGRFRFAVSALSAAGAESAGRVLRLPRIDRT